MSGSASGYRNVDYKANFEFQKRYFGSVWKSYKKADKAADGRDSGTRGEQKELAWKKAGICILCGREQMEAVLDEAFHIRDQEVSRDLELCRTVCLKHSYAEGGSTDPGREIMYLERTVPYLFSEDTVIITAQLGRQQLETACKVLLLREPDVFERAGLAGREAVCCESIEDLKRELSDLKVSYQLKNHLQPSSRQRVREVEVITGRTSSFLALNLVERLMDREKPEEWREDAVEEFAGYLLNEYEQNALDLLKAYLLDGGFAANFLFVEIYLALRQQERERFYQYVQNELLPSCAVIFKGREPRTVINNRLMENEKLRKADGLVSDGLTLLEKRLKRANEEARA